jgi:hypothetical protein
MVKGRLDIAATTATSYAWIVWQLGMRSISTSTGLMWVPPCRKQLERNDDYPHAQPSTAHEPRFPTPQLVHCS